MITLTAEMRRKPDIPLGYYRSTLAGAQALAGQGLAKSGCAKQRPGKRTLNSGHWTYPKIPGVPPHLIGGAEKNLRLGGMVTLIIDATQNVLDTSFSDGRPLEIRQWDGLW